MLVACPLHQSTAVHRPVRAALLQVIPLSEVSDVRKKKNVGFPNSIELTMLSGKREFFTSFLARADAYRCGQPVHATFAAA